MAPAQADCILFAPKHIKAVNKCCLFDFTFSQGAASIDPSDPDFTCLQGRELVEVGGKLHGASNDSREVQRDGPGSSWLMAVHHPRHIKAMNKCCLFHPASSQGAASIDPSDPGFTCLQGRELVEVGGKQRGASDGGHQVLRNGPGQAKAVIGGRATPQLVDDDQRLLARTLHITTFKVMCVSHL